MNRMIKPLLTCVLLVFTLLPVAAQESADTLQTLEQRYLDLLRRSETFKEYKVVRRSSLNMFWAALSDTVSTGNAELKEALVSKMKLEQELRQSQDSLKTALATIDSHTTAGARTSFLGMSFSRSFYNTLVWSLIVGLTGLMLFFLQRFKTGHSLVKETQDEHDQLQTKYDDLRHKAKETQMKLKRELQTALNKLETVERH